MTSIDQPRLATLCFLLFATASGGQIAAQLISPSGQVFDTPTATASALGNSPADWEAIWQADRQTELDSRITHLESTLADSLEFQNRLLELVEELTHQQSDTRADRSAKQTINSPAAVELPTPPPSAQPERSQL
ncbi:hypothetical protein [Microbulbifer pacificus]|uniref:YbgF trimerisation domain-containing protein n=1 Tax=Microbulbifer pacificus TaxID=407164 RepID=A0AAU0N0W7_9GAMM|nr:hypothetical protein [Microbulbifer pacificus]WOX06076.1 hypothetical protein R5R33_02745 [Microbulbifer pacificus]